MLFLKLLLVSIAMIEKPKIIDFSQLEIVFFLEISWFSPSEVAKYSPQENNW